MKLIAALSAALLFVGCNVSKEATASSSNPDTSVAIVTQFDGCKLYVIWTGERNVYVARCQNDVQTSWSENCGKGCVRKLQTLTPDLA